MSVILATQEAEIRKILVRNQPGQTVHETLSQKYLTHTKKGWWSGSSIGPEIKLQYQQKKKERKKERQMGW
jgi:hypothetical protein